MGLFGNILKTVGGIVGQALIPIPGVGAAIGSAVGGAVGGAVDGDNKAATQQQPQGKLTPTALALQAALNGSGGSQGGKLLESLGLIG